MHGLIFISLHDFVTSTHGADATARIFAAEPIHLLSESYPDEKLAELIERAARETGTDVDSLVFDFGVFTGERTFARLFPSFYDTTGSARDFLLTVETRIHELVREVIPPARPPSLTVTPLAGDGVEIRYESPRRLCTLLRGLATGAARRFGEVATVTEHTCMRRGDPACTIEIRLAPAD